MRGLGKKVKDKNPACLLTVMFFYDVNDGLRLGCWGACFLSWWEFFYFLTQLF